MILLRITHTARTPHPSSQWRCFDEREKHFESIEDAKAYLKDEYYYCKKRIKCYLDTTSRGTIHNGWIYCYKERDYNQHTGRIETHYRQDWVSFYNEDIAAIAV